MGLLAKGDDRHILVETFMACRFGQAALEVSRTIDLDFGLFNCLRCMHCIDPRPADSPSGGSNHVDLDSQAGCLAKGVLKHFTPQRSHHGCRANLRSPENIEDVHPADPLARHLGQVAGNALLAHVPVDPAPPDAGLHGIRRCNESIGQIVRSPCHANPLRQTTHSGPKGSASQ